MNGAVARHHAIAEIILFIEPKVLGAVHHKLANFLKRALIHQQVNAFAGGELALFVLGIDAGMAAAE